MRFATAGMTAVALAAAGLLAGCSSGTLLSTLLGQDVIGIAYPAAGTTVHGTVTVSGSVVPGGTATSISTTAVEMQVDSGSWQTINFVATSNGSTSLSGTWQGPALTSSTLNNGQHTITVQGYANGTASTTAVSVTFTFSAT
jgi:hypothetical protein